MYTQSSVQLRQLLIDNKATAHGVVVDSAIQSESTNKVVVLLFVDQTVTNTSAPDPRVDRSRMKITMEKVDGRWRASKVELLCIGAADMLSRGCSTVTAIGGRGGDDRDGAGRLGVGPVVLRRAGWRLGRPVLPHLGGLRTQCHPRHQGGDTR